MRWALHVYGHSISLVLCATWHGGAPGTALIIASQSGTAAQTRIGPSLSLKRASHTALALLMALRSGQHLVYGIQLSMTHPQMPIGSILLCSDSGRLSRGMHGDSADFNNSFIFMAPSPSSAQASRGEPNSGETMVATLPSPAPAGQVLNVEAENLVSTVPSSALAGKPSEEKYVRNSLGKHKKKKKTKNK